MSLLILPYFAGPDRDYRWICAQNACDGLPLSQPVNGALQSSIRYVGSLFSSEEFMDLNEHILDLDMRLSQIR
jgi:hypothetical protein